MAGPQDDLRQHLRFIAAGIGDLVPYGDGSDPDAAHCPECWALWEPSAERCADCGFPARPEHVC
jgi:hypothetical protein